jgi:phage terminase Nu1 subunit (DNA packaging protein)
MRCTLNPIGGHEMKLWLSVPEYAEHAGLSPRYIRDLIQRGQIVPSATRQKGGRKQVHWEKADASIATRVHTSHPGKAPRKLKPKPVVAKSGPVPAAAPLVEEWKVGEAKPDPAAIKSAGLGKLSFNDAKTISAQYQAALLKLDYGERSKSLVKVADVDLEFFNISRMVRDAILGVPGRVSAELAGVTEQHIIEARIMGGLVEALEELVRV